MGFLNRRFPDRIARGATGGHGYWQVSIVATQGGQEQANLEFAVGKGRWNVSQGLKREADFREIEAFFYMARARFHRWRFKDWSDYLCPRTDSFAQGRLVSVSSTVFQVCKVYGDDPSFEYVRPLTRLVAGTVKVWLDGALQSSPTAYEVDVDTGLVTFASSPGAATREVACEFDVPCRFDVEGRTAELATRKPTGDLLHRWESIAVVEVRE